MKKKSYHIQLRAFSLIEVAVVIIIIGVLVAGIFVSDNLITKSRLQMAVNLSKSSPINSIRDNVLWLETSLDSSLKDTESFNDASITAWNSQNNSGNKITVNAVGLGPVYANTINRIPAVKFDASSVARPSVDNYLEIEDASFLNKTDYTIFVLEKRQSNSSNNYFIGENLNGTANQSFALGYKNDSKIVHSQGLGMSYDSTVSFYADSKEKARLFTFIHSSTGGNKTYINGLLASEDSTKTGHLTNISKLSIGKGYSGEIGEIAFFTRALNDKERQDIEDYLSRKWDRKNLRSSAQDGSCSSGIITDGGCDLGYSCDAGYIGADCTACDESNGYYLIEGTCQQGCMVNITGASTTSVPEVTDSFDCDQSGYGGSIEYTCSDGVFSTNNVCAIVTGSANCTGGIIDNTSVSGSTIHKFNSSGTFTCSASKTAQVLVVAGGGGGGGVIGGGGGAGGVVYNSSYALAASSYNITVGAGGLGGYGHDSNAQGGTKGGDSVFDVNSTTLKITALGGGAGGHWGGSTTSTSTSGGSGGGGSNSAAAGSGTSGQGNSGGVSLNTNYAGGGGGAGSAGQTFTNGVKSGDGGAGVNYASIFGTSVGESGWFASGGGGGVRSGNGANGVASNGGGGAGTTYTVVAESGMPNTGGGGGGAGYNTGNSSIRFGGSGGSGVVLISYISSTTTCPSGYSLSDSNCIKSCDVSVAGVSTSSVFSGSGSLSCDVSGYSGSVSYNCSLTNGLSTTGQCYRTCTVSGVTGANGKVVSHGSTSTSCNAGYMGTINYTCNDGDFQPTGGSCSVSPSCTGGTVTNPSAGVTVHTFTSNGTFNCTYEKVAQILVIGGGGGGGGNGGGGGGGGGVVYKSSINIGSGSYNVVVGAGGSGVLNTTTSGANGKNSSINISGVEAAVGGGGGVSRDSGGAASTGGSGGGGGGGNIPQRTFGVGTSGQGYDGGSGVESGCNAAGGGGGGGGSAGSNAAVSVGGNGGNGYENLISGASVIYSSGGGGGRTCNSGGSVGSGGYGAGNGSFGAGIAATGYGSGGGGGGANSAGGAGKSGVVIIRY